MEVKIVLTAGLIVIYFLIGMLYALISIYSGRVDLDDHLPHEICLGTIIALFLWPMFWTIDVVDYIKWKLRN